MWKGIIFIRIRLSRLDLIQRSSSQKELISIKANAEKKIDKVFPGKMFTLIIFKKKVFLITSLQMWINFNTFSSSSRVDSAIQINFNLDAVDIGWKLLYRRRYQYE